jgi:hypothetical protein
MQPISHIGSLDSRRVPIYIGKIILKIYATLVELNLFFLSFKGSTWSC